MFTLRPTFKKADVAKGIKHLACNQVIARLIPYLEQSIEWGGILLHGVIRPAAFPSVTLSVWSHFSVTAGQNFMKLLMFVYEHTAVVHALVSSGSAKYLQRYSPLID